MTKKLEFATNIDMKGNEIQNVAIENLSSVPAASIPGRIVYVTGENAGLYVDTGAAVVKLGQASSADEVASRVGKLEGWQTTAKEQIATNASKSANNESDITDLKGRMDTAEGDIDALESWQTTAKGEISQAQTDITALQAAVGTSGEGDNLQTRVTALETNLATKQDKNTAFTDEEATALQNTLQGKIDEKANSADVYTRGQIDTTLGNYRTIADSYTKAEVDSAISAASSKVYRYKDSLANLAAIQAVTNPTVGDVYNAEDTGKNYAWNGTEWDDLGGTIDLSSYATISYVTDNVYTPLNQAIGTKVAQDAYDAKVLAIEGRLTTNEGSIATLQGDVADKVDQSAYDTKMGQLDSAIAGKAAKVAQEGGTYTKVTVNTEGIVSSGGALEPTDIPNLTAAKITDFATEVKKVRYKEVISSAGTSVVITHDLGVEYPHVTVFNTTTGAVIYAEVVYTDTNKVTINGNVDLGAITVVVSP